MKKTITEEIKETLEQWYINAILDQDKKGDVVTTIIEKLEEKTFTTLYGTEVNCSNVPVTYQFLFDRREQYRHLTSYFRYLLPFVQELYPKPIDEQMIQDSFYHFMIDTSISKEALITREPFIYLGLSAESIISCLQWNKECTNGLQLWNKRIVTQENCPPFFKPFYQLIQSIQAEWNQLHLDQIHCIRQCVLQDPEQADIYEQHKTKELMQIVTIINSLAIEISRLPHFKKVIEHVIEVLLCVL